MASADPPEEHEETPLLPNLRPTLSRASSLAIIHPSHSPRIIIAITFIVLFVCAFGGNLMQVPSLRLYEDIICHHYYDKQVGEGHIALTGTIDEKLCKGEEVQDELNTIVAGNQVVAAIPSLLLTVPFGLLADRIGRKPVFFLAMFGLCLQALWEMFVMRFWMVLPLRTIWLAPAFSFMGGGVAVLSMMVWVIISDVTVEKDRSNVFFVGICFTLIAQILAPTVASLFMAKSPWIPLVLGETIFILGFFLILFIPETLHLHLSALKSSTLDPDSEEDSDLSPGLTATFKSHLSRTLKQINSSIAILNSPRILLLLLAFLVFPFSNVSGDLLLRYISNRFSWTLREAGFLVSLQGIVNIFVYLIILPTLSHFFVARLHYSSHAKDLLFARISIIILIFGAAVIATSPTVILTISALMIFTLGTGFVSLSRAVITGLVDKEHVGRLYAVVSLVETIGTIAAGPAIAVLYAKGLKRGGAWVGLPFLGLAGVCMISAIGVWGYWWIAEEKKRLSGEEEEGRVGEENE